MSNFSAVLVGINKYKGSPLRGCINDVIIMRDILVKKYNIPAHQIRLILDERATKNHIEERLEWLATNDTENKLFHYSGHGAQIPVQNYIEDNYEPDNMDELLCPYDFSWEGTYITDNIIEKILIKMSDEHHMSMIFDCCHSGTIDRSLDMFRPISRVIPTPIDLLSRLSSELLSENIVTTICDPAASDVLKDLLEIQKTISVVPNTKTKTSRHNVSIITGCRDNQTSADAWLSNRFQGALSFVLQETLMSHPHITIKNLRNECERKLKKYGFTQVPQLISSPDNLNKPFIQI